MILKSVLRGKTAYEMMIADSTWCRSLLFKVFPLGRRMVCWISVPHQIWKIYYVFIRLWWATCEVFLVSLNESVRYFRGNSGCYKTLFSELMYTDVVEAFQETFLLRRTLSCKRAPFKTIKNLPGTRLITLKVHLDFKIDNKKSSSGIEWKCRCYRELKNLRQMSAIKWCPPCYKSMETVSNFSPTCVFLPTLKIDRGKWLASTVLYCTGRLCILGFRV